ncbi:hypothetical protein BH20ACT13_BH20ACT13_23270 [soil metagenome]
MSFDRAPRASVAAAALLALDVLIRLIVAGPYPGATFLLLAACGISLLPLLPHELDSPSLRVALLPALGLGSFAVLLTTVSIVGIPLAELSIRLAVLALVVAVGATAVAFRQRTDRDPPVALASGREAVAIFLLIGIFVLFFAAAWDVLEPFPPPGSDWGYYLLYADEIDAQGRLAAENPYGVGEVRALGSYPGVGAVYGSLRILDGVSAESLARGLAFAVALTPLALYAVVGALWGVGAGLLAAAAYAVAPIHLEPLYWHGLATTLGILFLLLTVLALALMYRGRRDRDVIGLLGFSLAGVAVFHSVSAGLAAVLLGLVLLGEVLRGLLTRQGVRAWWGEGMARPVLGGGAVGCVLGAGVIAHLRQQAAELGSPVSYRFYDSDWLGASTLEYYFSWAFLGLAAAGLALVVWNRGLRRDPALAAIAALVLAAVLVSQLWRVEVAFEYRRVVYYVAPALAILIGIGVARARPRRLWIAGYAVAVVYIAHVSIGFRLPERLLEDRDERSETVDTLRELGVTLDEEGGRSLVVADGCLGVRVPYLVKSPTTIAFEDWQAGFTKLVPEARTAKAVLRGGPEGRRLAGDLGVRYAVVDPRCTPNVETDLGGTTVFRGDELVIVELPDPS